VTDFENRLKRLLNENVDAELGPRRPAPRLELAATGRRGFRPWIMPLLATAGIAAVTAAIVVPVQLLADRNPDGSNGPANGGALINRSNSTAPATSPASSPSASTVNLGGATLRLPAGWVVRSYQLYTPSVEPMVASPSWCLTPASTPVSTAPGACPVSFGTIPRPRTSHVDPDTEGGLWGNPLYCIPRGGENRLGIHGADLPFGGRSADFRDWRFGCRDGTSWWIQQYLVASDPGFMLFSEVVTPEIATAISSIVAQSTLPARTGSLRYFDEGTVLESTQAAGGVRIKLKRQVFGPTQMLRAPEPAELDYLIPLPLFRQHQNFFRPHSEVRLYTDGSTVIWAMG